MSLETHLKEVSHIFGEEARAQSLLHLIVPLDGLLQAFALQQVDNWGKRFPVHHFGVMFES